jgi:RNA polymerase sigma-70 factor (ECF subfamily)
MSHSGAAIWPGRAVSGNDMTRNWPESTPSYDGSWPQTEAEFERLVDAYLDRLVRFALRQLGVVEDAEDVVQNVLIAAYRDRAKRRCVAAVGPYLYRSVANACTDVLRKRQASAVFREEVDMAAVFSASASPADAAMAADQWRRGAQLLARLPQDQAEVIRLRVFDEPRLSEIAELVGCPVNTVCSKLRYGFQKLRQLLARNEE